MDKKPSWPLIALVGPSGSGKTTLANEIIKQFFLRGTVITQVFSATTREKRAPDEIGHVFLSDEEFDKLENLVAYNEYNGYRYGATKDMVDAATIYVVDIPGLDELRKNYTERDIIAIGLACSEEELARRMAARGDTEEKIAQRLSIDGEAFAGLSEKCNITLNVTDTKVEDIADVVMGILNIQ